MAESAKIRVWYTNSGFRSARAAALVRIFIVEAGCGGRAALRVKIGRPPGRSRTAMPVAAGLKAGARVGGARRAARGNGNESPSTRAAAAAPTPAGARARQ